MTDPRTERLLALLQKALGHELPNRLLAVQGLARLLQTEEGNRLGPDGQEYLQRLTAASQQAHLLIKALADFLRTVRAADPPEPMVLTDALREAVAEVKPLCAGATFGYDFPEAAICCRLAQAAFRQVTLQLLRNAAQAAVPQRPLHIEVGARDSDTAVEFWVSDNGRGLTVEQQTRLFEPFLRRESGSEWGLGLILVRYLVEGWNGSLDVQSVPDQGSRFTVRVPKPRNEE